MTSTSQPTSGALAAAIFMLMQPQVVGGVQSATASPLLTRSSRNSTTWSPIARDITLREISPTTLGTSLAAAPDGTADSIERPTTGRERLIGELRRWQFLHSNWDGEGAEKPDRGSLKEATAFAMLLDEAISVPEPLLHASGHAGLFWNGKHLYADIEFLGNGRAAYYIERNSDKHKGIVSLDTKKVSPVLSVLLST